MLIWLPRVAALADAAAAPAAWLRIDDGVVVDSGQDDGWVADWEKQGDDGPDDRLIALAPAADVPLRWFHYPDAAPAQAAAAARIDALKASLGDAAGLHVVAGQPTEMGQAVPVAVTTHAAMTGWTGWLAARGLTAAAIIPAAAALPPPEADSLWSAELGGERIIRSADRAWASDPELDPLIAGNHDVAPLDAEAMREALLLTLAAPPLDLLSGAWKPKRRWAVDPAMLRLAKRLAIALVAVSVAIPIVYALRLTADTSRADDAVVAMATRAGVTASDASAAETEIDRRLATAGGGPLAFSVPASALYDAMRDAPGVSLKNLSHRTDGTLTTTLAAPRVDDINQVLLALQARGYRITAQPMAGAGGQQMAHVTIRAVP
ncbi:General secretion pathway L [Sphingopyxis alaskensis RB2256]|uniref:General secretion pathway L n=1 Tax=Sphingopyxis alaskensis (strain DSM 13593 / LMG 18877 / RB2256) TaxID=317655 RepID=Q1GWC6_SPHAL|nr:type II secretion system protein GspL [Sphingopyxis alaskensis]ABF52046.1 General secretion pathway L [Sphingopyxis alaskensis RB2256]